VEEPRTQPGAQQPTTVEGASAPPAGWYRDPSGDGQRYWDGERWTDQFAAGAGPAGAGATPGSPLTGTKRSSKSTWALVMGIMGIIILPVVFSILAIVFGVSARSDIDRNPELQGRGNATAGIVLGIIGLSFWALILIVVAS
jgi:hypothetical protein